jgi:hypothetical protein
MARNHTGVSLIPAAFHCRFRAESGNFTGKLSRWFRRGGQSDPIVDLVLRPSADGVIKLSARDASLHGRRIIYDGDRERPDVNPASLHDWTTADAYVTWFVDGLKAGSWPRNGSFANRAAWSATD